MIDLHTHTTASDGALTPEELLLEADRRGLAVIAITDHDTTAGLREVAGRLDEFGVWVVAGIEISATDRVTGHSVHVLGYGIDIDHPDLETVLSEIRARRTRYAEEMVARLGRAGWRLTWEEVLAQARGTAVYKVHILRALIDRGDIPGWDAAPEAYRLLFKGNGPARLQETYLEPAEAVELVRAAGGIPVLAHPGQFANHDLLSGLVSLGISGVEAFYPEHAPEVVAALVSFAEERKLLVTGGSDYHGGNGLCYGPLDGPLAGVCYPEPYWRHLAQRLKDACQEAV